MDTMHSLLSLPAELIIQLFGTCYIIDAVHLAAANRQLREVWLKYTHTIVEAILKPNMEAYDDAIDFAKLEKRYSKHGQSDPPPHEWLPDLLRNADLASTACAKHIEWIERFPRDTYWYRMKDSYTSRYTVYYLIRRFVLSYHRRELLPELRNKIQNLPEMELRTLDAFGTFLAEFMDYGERERQGIVEHPGADPRFADEEECGDFNYPEWNLALHEICKELGERNQALGQVPNALDG